MQPRDLPGFFLVIVTETALKSFTLPCLSHRPSEAVISDWHRTKAVGHIGTPLPSGGAARRPSESPHERVGRREGGNLGQERDD